MSLPLGPAGWTLRRWRPEDAAALAVLANNEAIGRWMSDSWPMPYTLADAQWWTQTGHAQSGDNWAICLHGEPQGGCGGRQETGFLRCNVEVGWWLTPVHWGQGVATLAARHCVARAFANPAVSRVYAPIHEGNQRSMRVAEKAGLRLEAVQPQSALKQGRVIARHVYAAYRD